ncbi:hypothetical protein CY35_11G081600 [Sphagnum magellanicum]|nr:hypothetical protein CY35_11G081600 [Sphagnum magellanicum]
MHCLSNCYKRMGSLLLPSTKCVKSSSGAGCRNLAINRAQRVKHLDNRSAVPFRLSIVGPTMGSMSNRSAHQSSIPPVTTAEAVQNLPNAVPFQTLVPKYSGGSLDSSLQETESSSNEGRGIGSIVTSQVFASNISKDNLGSELEHEASLSSIMDSGFEHLSVNSKVLPAVETYWKEAIEALKSSQVIAVPTDTLYGLACDACSASAILQIYKIKARSSSTPLAVCVADVGDITRYSEISHLPTGLLEALLPGPVTLLLPRGESSLLSTSLNPGFASIGIRIPDSGFIRGVCRAYGGALALTSANISSQLSTVRIEEFKELWPQCALVFDAGVLPAGRLGSTIADLTVKGTFRIVRSGSALLETSKMLERFGLRNTSF